MNRVKRLAIPLVTLVVLSGVVGMTSPDVAAEEPPWEPGTYTVAPAVPIPLRKIPRHRVGHVGKGQVGNYLKARVDADAEEGPAAQNGRKPIGDLDPGWRTEPIGVLDHPFQGNPIAAQSSEIVVAWEGDGDALRTKLFDPFPLFFHATNFAADGIQTTEYAATPDEGTTVRVAGNNQLDMIAADLDGDYLSEIVAAWEDVDAEGRACVKLGVFDAERVKGERPYWKDMSLNSAYCVVGVPADGSGAVHLASGDIDGDGQDEILLASEVHLPDGLPALAAAPGIPADFGAIGGDAALSAAAAAGDRVLVAIFDTHGYRGLHGPSPAAMTYDAELPAEPAARVFDVASGDLDGDADYEIVLTWVGENDDERDTRVRAYDVVDLDSGRYVVTTATLSGIEKYSGSGTTRSLAIASGDFNGDARDEIAIGLASDGSRDLGILQYLPTRHVNEYVIQPRDFHRAGRADREPGTRVSVAVGDLTADGDDEIVFAFEGSQDHGIHPTEADGQPLELKVYEVDAGLILHKSAEVLAPEPDAPYTSGDPAVGGLSVAVADMNRDNAAEVVLNWSSRNPDDTSAVSLAVYGFSLKNPEREIRRIIEVGRISEDVAGGGGHMAVAMGDFDGDHLRFELTEPSRNPPRRRPVIDATTGDTGVVVVPVATIGPLAEKGSLGPAQATATPETITPPDFNESDACPGAFVSGQIIERVSFPLVRIQEPPKHRKVIGGWLDVMLPEDRKDSYVSFENRVGRSVGLGAESKRDWVLGGELYAKVEAGIDIEVFSAGGAVETTLSGSYGEGFEKTEKRIDEVEIGTNVVAANDDVYITSTNDYVLWEYQVIDSSIAFGGLLDEVIGFVADIFPCSSGVSNILGLTRGGHDVRQITHGITVWDGLAMLDSPLAPMYAPTYQNGDLFSYNLSGPTVVTQAAQPERCGVTNNVPCVRHLLNRPVRRYIGANGFETWVDQSDIQEVGAEASSDLKLGFNIKSEVKAGFNIKIFSAGGEGSMTTFGNYESQYVELQEIKFHEDTSIHMMYAGVNPRFNYWVEPYVYWAEDGYLVVEHASGVGPSRWWDRTYGTEGGSTDLAFNLPFAERSVLDPDYQRSHEITFTSVGAPPDAFSVSATVHNWSLLDSQPYQVQFYGVDTQLTGPGSVLPCWPDVVAMGNLVPRASANAATTCVSSAANSGHRLRIFATIIPGADVSEVHATNNQAFGEVLIP